MLTSPAVGTTLLVNAWMRWPRVMPVALVASVGLAPLLSPQDVDPAVAAGEAFKLALAQYGVDDRPAMRPDFDAWREPPDDATRTMGAAPAPVAPPHETTAAAPSSPPERPLPRSAATARPSAQVVRVAVQGSRRAPPAAASAHRMAAARASDTVAGDASPALSWEGPAAPPLEPLTPLKPLVPTQLPITTLSDRTLPEGD